MTDKIELTEEQYRKLLLEKLTRIGDSLEYIGDQLYAMRGI